MSNKVAILIFANSAKLEAIKKPFQASENVFKALNTQTLKIAKKTGLPYFLFTEKDQVGSTFGERFTNAIQKVYNKGFDTVITIGNDTPHLQAKHLLKAVAQLQKSDVVLGPSRDGGFYLMGLKASHFNTKKFENLPWQTSKLHKKVSALIASKHYKLSYLEKLSDIDNSADAKHIIDSFKSLSKHIKLLLLQLVSTEKENIKFLNSFFQTITKSLHFNKGSPLFCI